MINFNLKLQKLCMNYGIELENYAFLYDDFLDNLKEIWEQISSDETIAFYGDFLSLAHIDKKIKLNTKNIVFIIENDNELQKKANFKNDNVSLIFIEDINKNKINKIIITKLDARKQMKQLILSYNADIEIIDLYDILCKKDIHYVKPFFFYDQEYYWDKVESIRLSYKKAKNSESLKLLIQTYLEHRDFICADIYISEYINAGYQDANLLFELKGELKKLLEELKKEIRTNNCKRVIVFVIDNFSYNLMQFAPFLTKFEEKSLSFLSAFPTSRHTKSCVYGFLSGKRQVTDEIYRLGIICEEDSSFLLDIKASDSRLKYISGKYCTGILQNINCFKALPKWTQPLQNWSLLTDMVNETKDCFYFCHIMENHGPFLSGNLSNPSLSVPEIMAYRYSSDNAPPGFFMYFINQMKENIKYIDRQMEFCMSLLDTNKDAVVITSDHGENSFPIICEYKYDPEQVPFIIHAKSITPGKYSDIYSSIDMPNILWQLMRGEDSLNTNKMEYARIEFEPYYGDNPVVYTNHLSKFGYIRMHTTSEVYCFYFNGSEEYFCRPDLKTNLINSVEYKNRIDYFRHQINLDTRELWKYMFSKYPNLLERYVYMQTSNALLKENKNPNKNNRRDEPINF